MDGSVWYVLPSNQPSTSAFLFRSMPQSDLHSTLKKKHACLSVIVTILVHSWLIGFKISGVFIFKCMRINASIHSSNNQSIHFPPIYPPTPVYASHLHAASCSFYLCTVQLYSKIGITPTDLDFLVFTISSSVPNYYSFIITSTNNEVVSCLQAQNWFLVTFDTENWWIWSWNQSS